MLYNLPVIMSGAWKRTRETMEFSSYAPHQLRSVFCVELREAWRKAKEEAALTARSVESLRSEIISLENRSFLGHEGRLRLARLESALDSAAARKEAEAMQDKRKPIVTAQARFCTVTFNKQDSRERVMRIQPASIRNHVEGQATTTPGRKGAVTGAARHPHLLPALHAEKQTIRSVNLATVSRIASQGVTQKFSVPSRNPD